MKKIVPLMVAAIFIFQALDALQLSQYRDFQLDQATKKAFEEGFSEDTDLIRGIVILRDGTLEQHRHYGNIKFNFKGELNSAICSYKDEGCDPMTQLLILTHPSAGGSGFNAMGTGSISEIFTNRNDLMQIISVMFKIAREARRNGGSKKKFLKYFGGIEKRVYDEELKDYFRREINTLQRTLEKVSGTNDINELNQESIAAITKKINEAKRSVTEKNLQYSVYKENLINYLNGSLVISQSVLGKLEKKEQLDRSEETIKSKAERGIKDRKQEKISLLVEAITGAVKLERIDENEDKWKKPYRLGYANDIICAYACGVISGQSAKEDLRILAEKLSANMNVPNEKPYKSKLSNIVWMNDNIVPSIIPFPVGQKLITNDFAKYSGRKNGETFSYKFADCVETTVRQLFSLLFCYGNDGLELERIPKNTALKNFFERKSVRDLANSGEQSIRNEWANICSGHAGEGILYEKNHMGKNGGYELIPCWRNIIKLFCLLMKNYKAKEDKEICNEKARNRKKAAEKCINDIVDNKLNINSDNVKEILNLLIGIRGDVELKAVAKAEDFGEQIVGTVKIYPKNEAIRSNNTVPFRVSNDHASVETIRGVSVCRTKNIESIELIASTIFSERTAKLAFLKDCLAKVESDKDKGWSSLAHSLKRSDESDEYVRILSINDVITVLNEFFQPKGWKVGQTQLNQQDYEFYGKIVMVPLQNADKNRKLELSITKSEDSSTDSSGFAYIEDLYYKEGDTSYEAYPVLEFYKESKFDGEGAIYDFFKYDLEVMRPYLEGIRRLIFDKNISLHESDIIGKGTEDEDIERYAALINELLDNIETNYSLMSSITAWGKRVFGKNDPLKQKAKNIVAGMLSDYVTTKNIDYDFLGLAAAIRWIAPLDASVLQILPGFSKYLSETDNRCLNSGIYMMGVIISAINFDGVSAESETFRKIKRLIQEFSIKTSSRGFRLNKKITNKSQLELLLPICYIEKDDMADNVIQILNGEINDLIIPVSWRIEEKKLFEYLKKIEEDKNFCMKCINMIRRCNEANPNRCYSIFNWIRKNNLKNYGEVLLDALDFISPYQDMTYELLSSYPKDENSCYKLAKKHGLWSEISNWIADNCENFSPRIAIQIIGHVSDEKVDRILPFLPRDEGILCTISSINFKRREKIANWVRNNLNQK